MIDLAWEAATDSRQCLKCSYAMNASMPSYSNYLFFTITWSFWYVANSRRSVLVAAYSNCTTLWTRHSLICAQKLLYTDHRSGHWE